MQKRYVPIAVIVAVLLAIAAVGYTTGNPQPDVPPRVLFDNSGGRVFFDHATHAEGYGYDCADCHHDGVDEQRPVACSSCHPKEFGPEFAKTHKTAFPSDAYCQRCHYEAPVEGMPEDERPDPDLLMTRADAFHGQCMGCHEAEDVGPYGEDSCTSCHAK